MNKQMEMIDRFIENIENYQLIDEGDTIIVGASGGPDSQFLIHMLKAIEEEYKLKIILAHLNHLHRSDAIDDENLVIQTANKLNLEVRIKKASMDQYAKDNRLSPEDAGRRLRYEFFNKIANDYPQAKIAVAHIKDDQAETMLLRMIRGTGLQGLRAMSFKSNNIIRPVLNVSKAEVLEFLNQNNITYAIDSTNLETDYKRNYIRHEIIPKMEELNPRIIDNFFTLSELLATDYEIISEVSQETFEKIATSKDGKIYLDKDGFHNASSNLKPYILRIAIEKVKGDSKDISKANIDALLSIENLDVGKEIELADMVFSKSYDSYVLSNKKIKKPFVEVNLDIDQEVLFGSYKIKATRVDQIDQKSNKIGYFNEEKLTLPLLVRPRKNGDRFKPSGFNHSKKLKDYFIDEKVDRDKRDEIPIITSNNDIIWVAGMRQAEDYKAKASNKLIRIEVVDDTKYE